MTECALGAVRLRDDPPPSLEWTPKILSSVQDSFIPPVRAPPPPSRGKSVRRTEGDPHFWLLDHIQVLTRDSDDSASTAGESTEKEHLLDLSKKTVKVCFERLESKRNLKEQLNFKYCLQSVFIPQEEG